jgi:hypothetical protein
MNTELIQLGALGFILLFTIKEIFTYMKGKNGGYDMEQNERLACIEEKVIALEKLTSNHVTHIQQDIELIRKDIDKICKKLNM